MAFFDYWKENFTYLGVFLGAILIIFGIGEILEYFFPKNKFSKATERVVEWIYENIIIV